MSSNESFTILFCKKKIQKPKNKIFRSSTGSNSNQAPPQFDKRWPSSSSSAFFGDQPMASSTPPQFQPSPIPSPLVCNKSPTSMTIKLRPSPNEPETSFTAQSPMMSQAQMSMFQTPNMMYQQVVRTAVPQVRAATPAQVDERAQELEQLYAKDVNQWTVNIKFSKNG